MSFSRPFALFGSIAMTLSLIAQPVLAQAAKSPAVTVALKADGIAVSAADVTSFKLPYPQVSAAGNAASAQNITIEKNVAKMKYANGASLTLTLSNGRNLQFHFTGVPAGAKMQMDAELPIELKDGVQYSADDAAAKPFPADKNGQFVLRGNVKTLRFIGPKKNQLALQIEHGWQQLEDLREFNTDKFKWLMAADMPGGGECWYKVSISDGSPEPEPARAVKQPAGPEKTSYKLVNDGIQVDAGSMGKFTLHYPAPGPNQQTAKKLIEKSITGNKATLKYEGSGQIDLTLGNDGAIALNFVSMPADVKHFRMDMLIDFSFGQGGTWKIDTADEKPFPKEKPAKPFLFQGHAQKYTFKNIEGRTLTLDVPQHSFAQLQDNREWGWKTFAIWFSTPYDANKKDYNVKVTVGAVEGAGPRILVDKFGQTTLSDYPAKVKTLEELKADAEAEKQWLASLTPPRLDAFGGLPGSGAKLGLKKTGFFHVEQKDNQWYLVNPEGNAFFQLGVCVFTPGDDYTYIAGREHSYEWLPPYEGTFHSAFRPNEPSVFSFHLANMIRKSGQPFELDQYLGTLIPRVRAWGFNSGGAFSPTGKPAQKKQNWPYAGSLPLSQWEGITLLPGVDSAWDPFDEKNRATVEKNFAARLPAQADDPLLIGYFLQNEPIYENLPKVIPTLTGKHACKRRLVQMLSEKYKTIESFNTAWGAHAGSFNELADKGMEIATAAAKADIREFVALFLDEYYRFVTQTARKHDPNHLLLGSRFQPGTIKDEQLVRTCGKYVDVMSFNYYTHRIDKDFLQRIYAQSGNKPMLLSEFFFCSPPDSGLPGGGIDVKTQQERGLAYRNYVEQSATTGFIVGIQWFTLIDQSVTGRFFEKYNGENANSGLISVADRPWKPMLTEMMKTNYGIYEVILKQRPAFVFDDPRFTTGK